MAELILEKPVVVPDTLFPSMVLIQTGIQAGKKVTSLQIHLTAAKKTGTGAAAMFEPTGQANMVYIPNIAEIDPDLVPVLPELAAAWQAILSAIGAINAIRKVM